MELIEKIKQKKELQGLSDAYVKSVLDQIIKKKKLSYATSKEEKEIIRLVRAELRLNAGRFTLSKTNADISNYSPEQILEKHSSTRERQEFYPRLKHAIHSMDHKTILDLGCGINPLVFATLSDKYYAYDIDESALKLVSEYFIKHKLNGQVHNSDINQVEVFPHVDLTFLLKVLDLLDKKGHKNAEKLLLKLNSKSIIISFSTKTLSGAPMNHPQRGWIERLLTRLGYTFKTLKSQNEIFYIASKETPQQQTI